VLWPNWHSRASAIAQDVRKVLQSAIANAENNHALDVDQLVVAEAHVGKATPCSKRLSSRAQVAPGQGASKSCRPNITIVVRARQENA